jgi:hypothetical protein
MKEVGPTPCDTPPPNRTKRTKYQRQVNDPAFDLRRELYRIAGVDLTDIPGVSTLIAQVILTEIGPDVSRFRNASAFASWLGLCPEKRVSGGKMLSCKTRKVKSRAAIALRLGAHSLCRAKDYFGEFFRRMRARLGAPQATPPQLTSWLGSSTMCSAPRRPTTKLSSTSTMNKPVSAMRIVSERRLQRWAFTLFPTPHERS